MQLSELGQWHVETCQICQPVCFHFDNFQFQEFTLCLLQVTKFNKDNCKSLALYVVVFLSSQNKYYKRAGLWGPIFTTFKLCFLVVHILRSSSTQKLFCPIVSGFVWISDELGDHCHDFLALPSFTFFLSVPHNEVKAFLKSHSHTYL